MSLGECGQSIVKISLLFSNMNIHVLGGRLCRGGKTGVGSI